MTKEELANQIDGAQYPFQLSKELKAAAVESGLVVVYGGSDDLMEFDGAIYDEIGASSHSNTVALVDAKGLLPEREQIDDDDVLEDFFARRKTARGITALWCKEEGYSWTYKTDIPCVTFEVMEDGEHYCRGLVFALADLGSMILDAQASPVVTVE